MNELELKFSLPPSLQASVAREMEPSRWRQTRIQSCYYDTPAGELTRARIALRVRRKGEDWLQTVKGDGVDHFQRFEWEQPIAGPAPERTALPPSDTAPGAVVHQCFERLEPLFETDCDRRSTLVSADDGLVIEIAQDIGAVRCGQRSEPIREIELECVRGSRLAFFSWAHAWAQRHEACLLMPTKGERGLRLAGLLPLAPAPVRAARRSASGQLRSPQALADLVVACLGHAAANIEPVLTSDDPQAQHQWHLALRRLRALIRLCQLQKLDPAWSTLSAEALALGRIAEPRALRLAISSPNTCRFILQAHLLAEKLAAQSDPRPMQ